MKVVRKGGEELGLVGVVEIHYIYTVYNFGPYLGLFLSILSVGDHEHCQDSKQIFRNAILNVGG